MVIHVSVLFIMGNVSSRPEDHGSLSLRDQDRCEDFVAQALILQEIAANKA